ncbi:ankyrin repeat-containing domain protein [Russula aff. rugulosa BPL654]|nr:ankyrin repeat-containing domain protein [Russula aff. rugulosa BPL654]
MSVLTFVDKNIWVAAGDGDLSRVRELIEHHSISPNVPDSFTYTPMHAAASYGHLDILTYLISKGGNVNVSDEDGDTPLYTVENIETARFLVDNGADLMWRNSEGLTPAASLEEDFSQVADFLNSLTATLTNSLDGEPENRDSGQQLSQGSQEAASERLTSSFMNQLSDLAQNEPIGDESRGDEELRQAVGHAVLESLVTGYTLTNIGGANSTTHTHSDETDG